MSRQILHHEITNVIGITHTKVHDEVFSAAEEEQLHHFWLGAQRIAEFHDELTRARTNCHAHKHLEVKANGARINRRSKTGDHTTRHKVAHARNTG